MTVAGLGNILAPEATGPRGPDLRLRVKVPSKDLGREGGVLVKVPASIEHEGRAVPRAASPHDPKGRLRLHLPAQVPEGAVLRLRGQGGLQEGASPGDLYIEVEVVQGRGGVVALVWLGALAAGVAVAAIVGAL